jgi:hypothetical protein
MEEAGSMEAGSGHEDSSHNITLDALRGFVWVPGNPWVVNVHADT